jgi:adenosylcobinamide kinase/adenosylcobinamide-phosphate guanylyltransferase
MSNIFRNDSEINKIKESKEFKDAEAKAEEVNELENKITQEVFSLIKVCRENDKKLIIVSNETGMGLVPPYFMGNYFRDMSGRVNNKIGAESDHMYFIFSGIPIKLKHKGEMVKWPQDF